MTSGHPHDPFRPVAADAPPPEPNTAPEITPNPEPSPEPERKSRRRGGRRKGAQVETSSAETAQVDEAEAELQRALAELDEKGGTGDDSAG